MAQEYNLWQQLLLGTTSPFRKGANILAQNWSSALTGKDMSQSKNQGKFLQYLASALTPEEQQQINEKPFSEALKSSAGMASTLMPYTKIGSIANVGNKIANPTLSKLAQLATRGGIEGGVGGFGYSRQGKELQDTILGALIGTGGEVAGGLVSDPTFRKGMAQEFKKANSGKYEAMLNLGDSKPTTIKVYRGEGGGESGKNSYYGRGKYLAASPDVAKKYGNVKEYTLDARDLFNTGDSMPEDMLSNFVDKFSKKAGISPREVIEELDFYKNVASNGQLTYDGIKKALNDFLIDKGNYRAIDIIKAEESVAEIINETLRDFGYKGLNAAEVWMDNYTGERIYNIFDESLINPVVKPGQGVKPTVIPGNELEKPMEERLLDARTLKEVIESEKNLFRKLNTKDKDQLIFRLTQLRREPKNSTSRKTYLTDIVKDAKRKASNSSEKELRNGILEIMRKAQIK